MDVVYFSTGERVETQHNGSMLFNRGSRAGKEVFAARLRECAALLLLHPGKSALEIFGSIDTLKLHSSLTLLTLASSNKKCVFDELLDQPFEGSYDINIIRMLMQLSD